MVAEIISNAGLSDDFETEWFSLIYQNNPFGNPETAETIQLNWSAVSGTLNGTLQLYLTNDLNIRTLAKTITISNSDNTQDAELLILYGSYQYFKINYINNGITDGFLSVFISYK